MKRIGVALTLILLMAGLFFFHTRYLGQLTNDLTDLLTQAEGQVTRDDWPAAETLTRQALELWLSNDFYLHSTMPHTDIDAILVHFHQVLAYLEAGEQQPAEYAAANALLIREIELLWEAELPTLQNIL